MTVGELIESLKKLPQNFNVYHEYDTFSCVTEMSNLCIAVNANPTEGRFLSPNSVFLSSTMGRWSHPEESVRHYKEKGQITHSFDEYVAEVKNDSR